MSEFIKPIFNQLEALSPGRKVSVVSAQQLENTPKIVDGIFVGVTPNTQGPLMIYIERIEGGASGYIPFAGSGEGIDSIIDLESNTPVFHNDNIPFPWFEPGLIDLSSGDEPIEQRQVDMGLYLDPESLRRAKEAFMR